MRPRNPGKRYQPSAPESLEGRIVLSGTSQVAGILGGHRPAVHPARVQTPSRPITMGAVGDSLTDEYISYRPDRSQARNWVELLSSTRLANFGKFSKASRGEPRNEGFAFNWARSDATSSDLVANQLAGLAGQVRRGQVHYASVIIGDNDFLKFLQEAPSLISDQSALTTRLVQTWGQALANFDTTVQTLLAANPRVRLVVGTVPDLTVSPAIREQAAPFGQQGQALLDLTSQAIARYNDHVREVANGNPRIALADLAAQTAQLESSPGMVRFGGQTIDLTTPGDNYHHFYLADNYHPGTVGQGLIANTIVEALDAKFHVGIRPLTPRQIIHRAQNVHRYP